jgi:MGT family glycosyltransferase
MARIAIICLPMASHLNLFLEVAEHLKRRGHEVSFIGIARTQPRVENAGFAFHCAEPDAMVAGTLGRIMDEMGSTGNLKTLKLQRHFDELRYEGLLRKGPKILERSGASLVIVDQAETCGGSVAEAVQLPWVSICNGLCLNSEPLVPPFITPWKYADASWPLVRNWLTYSAMKVATRPIRTLINGHRKRFGLSPVRSIDDTFSPYAQICQQNEEFDFPRRFLPATFRYVGPIRRGHSDVSDFPWNRLNNNPLIYASLGTIVNRNQRLYAVIAEACANLKAQLVLSLGGAGDAKDYAHLPGKPIVARYAPQRKLVTRAAVTITHAGLNTTLESLAAGTPLVAMPITFEQPAVAARIAWTNTGTFIPAARVTPSRLQNAIMRVLSDPSYKDAATRMSHAIARTPGMAEVIRLVEFVMNTGKPITAMG